MLPSLKIAQICTTYVQNNRRDDGWVRCKMSSVYVVMEKKKRNATKCGCCCFFLRQPYDTLRTYARQLQVAQGNVAGFEPTRGKAVVQAHQHQSKGITLVRFYRQVCTSSTSSIYRSVPHAHPCATPSAAGIYNVQRAYHSPEK